MEIGQETPPVTAPVAFEKLLGDALRLVFRAKAAADVGFSYELRHHLLLEVNEGKVLRVLANILENAEHAMRGKGTVRVTTEDAKGRDGTPSVKIVLANSGSYIEPAVQARLFELFFTHGKPGGTGLGLAICKRLVERHGGTIACESHPQKGTEFILTLPAGARVAAAGGPPLPGNSRELILDGTKEHAS
jgi:signal transduction histidine kinase